MFDKLIGDMVKGSESLRVPAADDYRGKDGLLRCGRCHTPKECVFRITGRVVGCVCRCESERRAEEERRERAERLRDRCFRYADAKQATFERDLGYIPKVSEAARRYAENFERFRRDGIGMLLYGPFGTGKSFYAYAIANALVDRLYRVRAWQLEELHREYEEGGRRTGFFSYMASHDLVVIDDLGAEKQTRELTSFTFNAIDALYSSRTPFVITTNVALSELTGTRDGDRRRIYERILERCPQPVLVDRPEGSIRYTKLREQNPEYKKLLGL